MGAKQSVEKPAFDKVDQSAIADQTLPTVTTDETTRFSTKELSTSVDTGGETTSSTPMEPPPTFIRHRSFEERFYDKFVKQPLVPIGCLATTYFLVSGIKSMTEHNPRRAQKMMRGRVLAQGATIAAFIYYVGWEKVDFSIMPRYFQMKEAEKKLEEEQSRKENQVQSQN